MDVQDAGVKLERKVRRVKYPSAMAILTGMDSLTEFVDALEVERDSLLALLRTAEDGWSAAGMDRDTARRKQNELAEGLIKSEVAVKKLRDELDICKSDNDALREQLRIAKADSLRQLAETRKLWDADTEKLVAAEMECDALLAKKHASDDAATSLRAENEKLQARVDELTEQLAVFKDPLSSDPDDTRLIAADLAADLARERRARRIIDIAMTRVLKESAELERKLQELGQ